ncbi:MAG: 6,7-dimethyl-8-ribityllumazine synthase [Elusimicrobiota bacterium]
MGKKFQGKMLAEGKRFAIVVSRFNEFITRKLLEGAEDSLIRHGADQEDIDVFWAPGSFEIPQVTKRVAQLKGAKKYDAIVCLGAIIQGDTPHYEYIAAEVTKGIAQVSLENNIPVSFGILTTDNLEQAIERAGTKAGNKGAQAAESAIEMCNLLNRME